MTERKLRDKIEEAVHFISLKFANATDLTKPVLCHSLRVGFSLYDRGYKDEIVLAGFLHDLLEDTMTTKDEIAERFGFVVAEIVEANSKDSRIENKNLQKGKMIDRCIAFGEDALIVKAADILENFDYSEKENWEKGLINLPISCEKVFGKIPDSFTDPIFSLLRKEYFRFKEIGKAKV